MVDMNEQGGIPELFVSDDSSSVPTPEAQFELEHEVVDSGSSYSSRIDRMSHQRSLSHCSDIEFDTAFSKEHWAEFDPSFAMTKEVLTNPEETEEVFNPGDFALGPQLAEGVQAAVCKASVGGNTAFAVKVFKRGSVQDLRSRLPANLFACSHPAVCRMIKGVILEDKKYAILMEVYLRDLRKAMDVIMLKHNNQGPPFQEREALFYMLSIACGVHYLYSVGILHRDLKAANVLVWHPLPADYQSKDYPPAGVFRCAVSDYECSAGILGSGLWRAPELLKYSLNRPPMGSSIEFITKMDVYGYAMTCYEILTGLVPFVMARLSRVFRLSLDMAMLNRSVPRSHFRSEFRALIMNCLDGDEDRARCKFVEMVTKFGGMSHKDVMGYLDQNPLWTSLMIDGNISSVIRSEVWTLIRRCLDGDPNARPEFTEIMEALVEMVSKLGFKREDVVGFLHQKALWISQMIERRLGNVSSVTRSEVRTLLSRCLDGDPNARPEFTEIMEALVEMVSKLGFKREDVVGFLHQKPLSISQMIESGLGIVSSVMRSDKVRTLIRRCLDGDPDARPEFTEIMEDLVEMVSKLGFKREDVVGFLHQKALWISQMIERRLGNVSSVMRSDKVRTLLSRCLDGDPDARPEFTKIMEALVEMVSKLGFKREDVVGFLHQEPLSISQMIERGLGIVMCSDKLRTLIRRCEA